MSLTTPPISTATTNPTHIKGQPSINPSTPLKFTSPKPNATSLTGCPRLRLINLMSNTPSWYISHIIPKPTTPTINVFSGPTLTNPTINPRPAPNILTGCMIKRYSRSIKTTTPKNASTTNPTQYPILA